MNGKSIGLIILWWCEAIISVRVLLFSLPVIINKSQAKIFDLQALNDRFIVVMSATALLYFVVGVASICGYRYWKAIHYLAAIFTVLLTVGSLVIVGQPADDVVGGYYFFPIIVSAIFVCLAGFLARAQQPA
jgi:hypothetical protein